MTRIWAPVGVIGGQGVAGLAGGQGPAAQGQGDLEDQQLVVDEPVAGALLGGQVGRAVDGLEGLGPGREAVALAQRLGQEVGHLPVAVEQGSDGPAQPPRRDVLGGRVDGDDLAGEALGVVALAKDLVAGVGHAEAAGLPFELAREGGQGAHRQLLGMPGLVEPGAGPHAAAVLVSDPHLEDAEVAPGLLLGDVADRADHGHYRALLGVGQVGQLAPGQVAARVVLEQVADGAVPERVLDRAGQSPGHLGHGAQPGAERVGRHALHHPGSIGTTPDTRSGDAGRAVGVVARVLAAVLPFRGSTSPQHHSNSTSGRAFNGCRL